MVSRIASASALASSLGRPGAWMRPMRFKGNSGSPSARPRTLEAGTDQRRGQDGRREARAQDRPDRAEVLGVEPRPRHARRRCRQRFLGRAPPATGRAAERERDRRSLLHLESLGGDPDQGLLAQKLKPLEPLVVGDQCEIERARGDLRTQGRSTPRRRPRPRPADDGD